MHFTEYDTRVAAYAVVVDQGRLLLAWFNGGRGQHPPGWTLPGGGVEFGESIEDAVVREVREETGYDVDLTEMLCTHSFTEGASADRRPFKSVRLVYAAAVTGGSLGTLERGGTTDHAAWISIDAVPSEGTRSMIVDEGLRAWRQRRP